MELFSGVQVYYFFSLSPRSFGKGSVIMLPYKGDVALQSVFADCDLLEEGLGDPATGGEGGI